LGERGKGVLLHSPKIGRWVEGVASSRRVGFSLPEIALEKESFSFPTNQEYLIYSKKC
jgi:hypothetical protein